MSQPRPTPSTPSPLELGDYFEAKYRANDDPWDYATSPYEAHKYAQTLAALPRPRYARALEIGCSVGVFTRLLAARCGDLLALDIAPSAVAQAQRRTADLPHVRVQRADAVQALPDGPFNLIVLAEVGYYWSPADLRRVRDAIVRHLAPGGDLVLVHWTPTIDDAHQTGDTVHAAFLDLERTTLVPLHHARFATFRLDVLRRV